MTIMEYAILILCILAGLAIYFGIVRPWAIPLEWRIPTGRAYQIGFHQKRN